MYVSLRGLHTYCLTNDRWKSNSLSKVSIEEVGAWSSIQILSSIAAVQHMSTYWSLLERIRGSKLRLTKLDDEIYNHFKSAFPDFDPRTTIDEDKMKSKEGKAKWREFMMAYEKTIDDYNFGTMLRSNPKFEYGEIETIFGLRRYIQDGGRNKY